MSIFKSGKAISLTVLEDEEVEEPEPEVMPPVPSPQIQPNKRRKKKVEEEDDQCVTIKKHKNQHKQKEHKGKEKPKHNQKKDKDKEKDKEKDDLEFLDRIILPSDVNYNLFQDNTPAEDSKRMELEISLKRLKYKINQIKHSEPETPQDNEVHTIRDPTIIELKLQDSQGGDHYKISVYRDAPLSKLLDTLKNLVCHTDITLTFDGITVDPRQAPKDYGMYSNNVLYFRTGSEKSSLPAKTSVHNIKKVETSDNHNSNSNLENPAKKRKALVLEEDEEEAEPLPKPPLKKISLGEVEETMPQNKDKGDDEDALERELEEKLSKKAEKAKQEAEDNKKNTIKLVVRTAGGADFKFRIKRTDPISKLIEAAANNQKVSPSTLILKFEGEILKPNKSPDFYELENDDLLDLFKNDRCK
eukprot:TRINITY_DN11275_c0_g1_i1.p1 TRINITY_DN11275_c0_g1~~TRINITY_DN11275_c0_g1_i1.p1  ORF type:complete len:415 (-),score=102.17 TRINITY_DN11275_c0_g1_i1:33-1277(-)